MIKTYLNAKSKNFFAENLSVISTLEEASCKQIEFTKIV